MPSPVRLTAPPSRLAVRHASGFCVVDHDVLDAARRLDERQHMLGQAVYEWHGTAPAEVRRG